MIGPELQKVAFYIRLINRPSVIWFRFLCFISKRHKGKMLKGFDCDEKWIPRSNENSDIRIRIFQPLKENRKSVSSPEEKSKNYSEKKLPAVLYLHGGGYVLGVAEVGRNRIKKLLKTRDCVVIAPDYRKAFEKPFPAALDDSYDTLLWIKNNADQLGIRDDQIMIIGHSAGGGLAAATSAYARDKAEVKVAFQMPIYPMIDDRMEQPSAVNNTEDPVWNSVSNRIAWDLYLRDYNLANENMKYAAPSRETNYIGLPPTATFVGSEEPFRDETIAYVKELEKANVPVQFRLYEGGFHGFESLVPTAKISIEAEAFYEESFAYGVDNYFAEQK